MKIQSKSYTLLLIIIILFGFQFTFVKEIKYRTGDVIFLSNSNAPDKLLNNITKSKFSHLGIVVKEKGKLGVYYAGSTVKKVSIPEFLALSANGKFEVLRYKDTLMISNANESFVIEAKKLLGFNYDNKYSWMDQEIYNAELVWKIYKRAMNIELCNVKLLSSISVNDSVSRKKIISLHGDSIPPTIKIVSPNDIYTSEFLIKIK